MGKLIIFVVLTASGIANLLAGNILIALTAFVFAVFMSTD